MDGNDILKVYLPLRMENHNTQKLNELANTSSWWRNCQSSNSYTDANFEVCALVHDAVLIQIPIPEYSERLKEAKQIGGPSVAVVGGPIRVVVNRVI